MFTEFTYYNVYHIHDISQKCSVKVVPFAAITVGVYMFSHKATVVILALFWRILLYFTKLLPRPVETGKYITQTSTENHIGPMVLMLLLNLVI
jgi:hypothetical protein